METRKKLIERIIDHLQSECFYEFMRKEIFNDEDVEVYPSDHNDEWRWSPVTEDGEKLEWQEYLKWHEEQLEEYVHTGGITMTMWEWNIKKQKSEVHTRYVWFKDVMPRLVEKSKDWRKEMKTLVEELNN